MMFFSQQRALGDECLTGFTNLSGAVAATHAATHCPARRLPVCDPFHTVNARSCYTALMATKKKRSTLDQKLDGLTTIIEKAFAAVATDSSHLTP